MNKNLMNSNYVTPPPPIPHTNLLHLSSQNHTFSHTIHGPKKKKKTIYSQKKVVNYLCIYTHTLYKYKINYYTCSTKKNKKSNIIMYVLTTSAFTIRIINDHFSYFLIWNNLSGTFIGNSNQ